MRFLVLFAIGLLTAVGGYAQFNGGGTQFYIGPKTSLNVTQYKAGKNLVNVPEADGFSAGYGVGFMYKFKVTDLISLHGELNYVRKNRRVQDSLFATQYANNHLDAPILFEFSFPAKLNLIGDFEYFFNAGGQISYWLNGIGTTHSVSNDSDFNLTYPIRFSQSEPPRATIDGLNRLQYGFIAGAGLTIPSVGDNYFVIEARYHFSQTYLGDKSTVETNNFTYEDDLRGNYQIFSVSFAYTFGLNFMPNQKKSGVRMKTVVR